MRAEFRHATSAPTIIIALCSHENAPRTDRLATKKLTADVRSHKLGLRNDFRIDVILPGRASRVRTKSRLAFGIRLFVRRTIFDIGKAHTNIRLHAGNFVTCVISLHESSVLQHMNNYIKISGSRTMQSETNHEKPCHCYFQTQSNCRVSNTPLHNFYIQACRQTCPGDSLYGVHRRVTQIFGYKMPASVLKKIRKSCSYYCSGRGIVNCRKKMNDRNGKPLKCATGASDSTCQS